MEKASMLLAINMTLLMVDGIIAICAKLIADSVFTAGLVELEQDFCIFS